MSQILTLEQLPDIDTFTLEEKIEQLENHPHAQYFGQLIALAQLELQERYKVEQFGRKLINDEIPVLPEISFAKIKISSISDAPSVAPPSQRNKKFNYAQFLKRTVINESNEAFISKPMPANNRYKPKNTDQSQKKDKKSGSQSFGPRRKTTSNLQNKPYKNHSIKIPTLTTMSSKDTLESLPPISKSQPRTAKSIPQTFHKQKTSSFPRPASKIEQKSAPNVNKKIQIRYIQNDVYDEKLFLPEPQNLLDVVVTDEAATEENASIVSEVMGQIEDEAKVQVCIGHEDEDIEQDISQKKSETAKMISWEDYVDLQQSQGKQVPECSQGQAKTIICEQLVQVQEQSQLEQSVSQNQPFEAENHEDKKIQLSPLKNSSEDEQIIVPDRQQVQQPPPVLKKIQQKTQSSSKIQLNVKSYARNTKSISHKLTILKTDSPSTPTDVIDFDIPKQQKIEDKKAHAMRQTMNVLPRRNPSNLVKQGRPILNGQRTLQSNSIYKQIPISHGFPYHEMIPTFNKLFPHICSSSIVSDLRAIQQQLQDHLNKKITRIALQDQYLRIRQQQLQLRVVMQCQKAQKFSNVFGIDLESFIKRGKTMLNRISSHNSLLDAEEEVSEKDILLYRVVRQKEDVYDIVNSTFHRTKEWYELPHGMELKTSWNLLWTWSRPQIEQKYLCYFQKVNHFFGNKQIARKDLLKKNIEKIKKLGKRANSAFDIIPETFYLPGENMQFVRKFRECGIKTPDSNYWIMKPVGMSRGRGIQLVNRIEDIVFNQPVVLQKYLMNPLLLSGHKFDLRIYVLVTSINPLQAFIYQQGFARISTQKYSTQESDLSNKFIHLTNFSVQKENIGQEGIQGAEAYNEIKCMSLEEKEIGGCKITLKSLRKKLQPSGIDWETQIRPQIESIVVKSLISVMNSIEPNPNCFELFGYDIMIDEDLKCWLIEVNSSPSLEKDFLIDEIVKQQLVDDIIQIVNPVSYDRKRLLEVVVRRRKQMEGLKSHINPGNNSVQQLNSDIGYILHGKPIGSRRQVGSTNFRQVAPGPVYQNLVKIVQQYKIDPIAKKH